MRALLLMALLTGCTAGQNRMDDQEALARELAGRVAGEPRSCVPASANQALTVADRRTLTYRSGDTLWVNRLGEGCSGFDPMDVLVIESQGGSYCRGDRVRGVERGMSIPGPICMLREFTPYRKRG